MSIVSLLCKANMSKKYNWRSVLYIYIPIVLFTPLFSEKSYANKYVKSQDALTISSNLAQSSSLVEAKRFQIATENLVNMNSTISHYKKKTTLQKVVFIKLDDGWPESVEEQGLLLLVWRHNFTNNI